MAGGADKLRLPDYGQKLVARIPRGRLYVFPNAGHSPNIECAEQFNKIVLTFLDRVSVAPKAPAPQQA
jgi:pimeloyl-ACP methyl ester carboxylesterase